jgi:DNA repair protein RecO (recombination protein O)
MSEIVKTEAFVLVKRKYGDSSKITTLFTLHYGKISAIIKGGRRKDSAAGRAIDPLNYISIVFYKKENRDLQTLTGADLIDHYPYIKQDFDRIKYASAVLELIKELTVEYEENERLFRGVKKIMQLMETGEEMPEVLFARFYLFFLTELGYELQLTSCSMCGNEVERSNELKFDFRSGVICKNCAAAPQFTAPLSMELFDYLICLKTGSKKMNFRTTLVNNLLFFLERYTNYHVSNYKGLKSLQLK